MGKEKKKRGGDAPGGAPEWVMTYGDMMSLLLTFFIMLVAMSEIKKEDQWRAIVEAVKKSFGMKVGGGSIPSKEDPLLQHISVLDEMHLKKEKLDHISKSVEDGPDGKHNKVTKPRPSLIYVEGGAIIFEPGSADLSDTGKKQLRQIGEKLRGLRHKIEVHGHASSIELELSESNYSDLRTLSYDRAVKVADYLTGSEGGLDPQQIRVIANADNEPVKQREQDVIGTAPNRRVEIIRTDNLVEDFTRPDTGSFSPGQ